MEVNNAQIVEINCIIAECKDKYILEKMESRRKIIEYVDKECVDLCKCLYIPNLRSE